MRSIILCITWLALAVFAGRGEDPKPPDLMTLVKQSGERVANAGAITLSYADVVDAAQPSVATILTLRYPKLEGKAEARKQPDSIDLDLRSEEPAKPEVDRGGGSGVILTAQGHILTNNHVVEDADAIFVRIPGESKDLRATLVGRDPTTDVALLKVEASALKPITIADSSAVRSGDVVLALGSPFGLEQTVTLGIVSAKGRSIHGFEDFIQTDAPINPGNSGGALVDGKGRLVGINTAGHHGNGWMMANSIGFAVPSNLALRTASDLLKYGYVVRGYLGTALVPVEEEVALTITGRSDLRPGKVTDITMGSPADKAGFASGDIITAINGAAMTTDSKTKFVIATISPGTKTQFTILRGKDKLTLEATLTKAPRPYDIPLITKKPDTSTTVLQAGLEICVLTAEQRFRAQLPGELGGVTVTKAENDGVPMTALLPDDVVTKVNGKPLATPDEAKALFDSAPAGKTVMLTIQRKGQELFASVRKK